LETVREIHDLKKNLVIFGYHSYAFVGQYTEHTKRHGVSNIKFENIQEKETGLKL